jgi:hypothetical protein
MPNTQIYLRGHYVQKSYRNFNHIGVRTFILYGAPERIRTSDPQIRSLVLYPAELRARAGHGGDHRAEAVGLA